MESHYTLPAPRFERPTRLLVVVAPFYRDIADALLAGAPRRDRARPAPRQETVEVPGALELPTAIGLAGAERARSTASSPSAA